MSLDREILYLINNRWSSPALDFLMPRVSSPEDYLAAALPVGLLALALVLWLLARDGVRGRLVVAALVLAVGASDVVAARVIKPSVARLRPCRPEAGLQDVIPRSACLGRHGFPSNHAANTAAAALILGWRFRRRWWIGAALAALVGYSRVYMGAHYPGDVLGGWALGAALGALALWGLLRPGRRRFAELRNAPED